MVARVKVDEADGFFESARLHMRSWKIWSIFLLNGLAWFVLVALVKAAVWVIL